MHRAPTLTNSIIRFTCDDILNIHSKLDLLLGWASTEVALVLDTMGSSSPGDYDPSTASSIGLGAGSTARLWSVAERRLLGNATLAHAPQRCSSRACQALADGAIAQFNAQGAGLIATHPLGDRVLRLELQQHAATPAGNTTVITFPSRFAGGAVVVNNTFSDSYGRCGLYNAPHSVVTGNDCRRAGPMFVGIQNLSWLEGPLLVSNVTVANNHFVAIDGAATAAAAVVVAGNGHTENIRVFGNTLG